MKTNRDFRKSGDDSRGGGYVKGKVPLKMKKSKRSIYNEIEEDDEDIGYSDFQTKESVEDYFDDDYDYDYENFDEEFDFIDDEYDGLDDDEF
jgi:hypothetical protein